MQINIDIYIQAGLEKKKFTPIKSLLERLSTLSISDTIRALKAYPKEALEGKEGTPRHTAAKVPKNCSKPVSKTVSVRTTKTNF